MNQSNCVTKSWFLKGRQETCQRVAEETGYPIVHPYDNYNIMAGQGTTAFEMIKHQGLGDMDAILTTVSGGGLASGLSLASKSLNPNMKGEFFWGEPYDFDTTQPFVDPT